MDTLGEKEVTSARVVKLFPVITLNNLDVGAKLGGGVGDEVSERAESVRFKLQRKSPQVLSAIIKYNQIIFVTGNINNWRGPQVTMNKIKLSRSTRGGHMKGQMNMVP
jgi:hypothetical protein